MVVDGVRCGGLSFVIDEVIVEHQGIFGIHHRLVGVIQLRY